MKGLLTKDFYMLLTSPTGLYIPLFILLGVLLKNPFFLTYIGVIFAMTPISLMTMDENSHWERYAFGLPFNRRMIVSSKYIMTLLLTVFGAAVMLLMSLLIVKTGAMTFDEALPAMFSSLTLCLLFPAVLYPLNFKLGTAKARIAMLAAIGLVTAGFIMFNMQSILLPYLPKELNTTPPALVCCIGAAVLLALFAASWALSVRFYTRREF